MPTEQIFALYIDEYDEIVDPVFIDASSSNILSAYQSTIETWYETSSGGASDKRYQTFRNVSDNGKIKKVAISTYIITPYNVDIVGDLIDELENNGMYL